MTNQIEQREQISFTNYIKIKYPNLLWTISTGGVRLPIGLAKKMKNMGYVAGTPDIMIFEPNKQYKGLFIELKRPKTAFSAKGATYPHQTAFLGELSKRGYKAVVCYGSGMAIETLEDYLNG